MAVLLTVPSLSYTPRLVTVNPTFQAGFRGVKLTITGPTAAWPAGIDFVDPATGITHPNTIGRMSITRPNGEPGGAVVWPGGTALNRAGVPLLTRDFQGALQSSQLPLAADWGPYTVTAQTLVDLTFAILVEQF